MKIINFLKSNFLKLICINTVKPILLSEKPTFLILMSQNIGDMIVCSPILRELKLAFPNSELQVIIKSVNKEMAEANPYIDEIHIYRNKWICLFPLLIKLRRKKFDIAVELEAKVLTKVILMLKIIKPRCTLAVRKTEGRYGMTPEDVFPYDFYTDSKIIHQRDTAIDILRLLNINPINKHYDIFLSQLHKSKSSKFLSKFDQSKVLIGFNLEGSSIDRRISKEDATIIIEGLAKISKNIIFLLINKPGNDKITNEIITNEISSFVFPCLRTNSVLDIAAIINDLDLVISPDTSIVHMACAFKTPLLAIYENNRVNYEKWSPISNENIVIFSNSSSNITSIDTSQVINSVCGLILEKL